jgi:2-polyprenyl-3-methyl-5-hydroxy-6-metoxy-1,4-benzoquinol methylase
MMLGTKEEFEYYQCRNCEALQIKSVPDNIFKYYGNYYTQRKGYSRISTIKKILWGIRSDLALTILYPVIEFLRYNSILHWAHLSKINKNSGILDVGCGNGDVLFEFSKHGFKNLFGIDPYLENIKLPKIEFEKTDLLLFNTELKFDLIMFNHSLEHLYEQHATLEKALGLLNVKGAIMIRIPLVNKAFEIYKENWVQIDAPRHFIIHSLKSMQLLCAKNGAEIYNYFFDSNAFQFLGSEQFKKGISSYAMNSYKSNLHKSIFSNDDIKNCEAKAKQFNLEGLGDQAVFFIRRKSESKL